MSTLFIRRKIISCHEMNEVNGGRVTGDASVRLGPVSAAGVVHRFADLER